MEILDEVFSGMDENPSAEYYSNITSEIEGMLQFETSFLLNIITIFASGACTGPNAVYFEGQCYEVSSTKLNGSMAEEFCNSTAMGGSGSTMIEQPTLEDTFFLRGC